MKIETDFIPEISYIFNSWSIYIYIGSDIDTYIWILNFFEI